MAETENSTRLRVLYLMKILLEKTDEQHSVTMQEIIGELHRCGVSAERKAVYLDIESLRSFGIDIICEKWDRNFHYSVASRDFELAELKLLVDSVQSARFITRKKSDELISKIERLASKHEAKSLQRQVYVADRVKSMNESIYYNIDALHTAISSNCQISFNYFSWNINKEQELRHNGRLYRVSPWACVSDDENYYLVGYDSEDAKIKHFRTDKMLNISILDEAREGREMFENFNLAVYTAKRFGMFDGKEETVKLLCENYLSNVIVDRFGKDVMMIKADEEHFTVNVRVAVSGQFFGWIFSLGRGAKIIGPDTVVERMREEAEALIARYRQI